MKEVDIPLCPKFKIECANARKGCDPETKVCQTTALLNAQMAMEFDDENIINYRGGDSWRYPENYESDEFEQGDPYG